MINNYSIFNVLGEGAFGKVKLAAKTIPNFEGFRRNMQKKFIKRPI